MARTVASESFFSRTLKDFLRKVVFSSQGFPIIITLSALGILLVLFRMKNVEQDYKINEVIADTKKISYENKDLKARKAGRLSVKNLRSLAKKYKLAQPKQNQVIVIP